MEKIYNKYESTAYVNRNNTMVLETDILFDRIFETVDAIKKKYSTYKELPQWSNCIPNPKIVYTYLSNLSIHSADNESYKTISYTENRLIAYPQYSPEMKSRWGKVIQTGNYMTSRWTYEWVTENKEYISTHVEVKENHHNKTTISN